MSERNKALVREMFAATEKGDVARLFELLDPDMVLTLAGTTPLSGRYEGGAAVADLTRRVRSLIDHVSLEVDELVGDGDIVVGFGRGAGVAKTGRPYNNTYVWRFRLVNDRIVEYTEFGDTALVETALFGKDLVETGSDSPKVGAAS